MKHIPKDVYAKRCQQLLAHFQKQSDLQAVWVSSAPQVLRNGDTHFRYRQHSDFLYLTGFSEPHALLLLLPGRSEGQVVLFHQPKDPFQEVWTGERLGQQRALDELAIDQAFSTEALPEQLPKLLQGRTHLYSPEASAGSVSVPGVMWLAEKKWHDLSPYTAPMRLVKDAYELERMAHAASVSAQAHGQAMAACYAGCNESFLHGQLLQGFYAGGLSAEAYPSIVAGGARACTLHYDQNNQSMLDGDLVLVDAGGESQGYAADITRTYPVNGRFTGPQQQLYSLVLEVQLAAIDAVQPGVSARSLRDMSQLKMTEGLCHLGILKGSIDDLMAQQAFKKYYMHGLGHWLGLDVHDVGRHAIDQPMVPGMVMTIEPGVYISHDDQKVAAHWRGIGIRIEDDVQVTEQGAQVLSWQAPKTISELEQLVGSSHGR